MKGVYDNVYIKRINYIIPGVNKKVSGFRVLTSELEKRVLGTVKHLPFKIPEGFLRFYTDVRERYWWREDVNLIQECQELLDSTLEGVPKDKVLSVRYGTLTRQFIEPATSTMILSSLGFSKEAVPYDTPNACLGMMNGVHSVANEIELQQSEYGVVIGFEDSRQVTLDTLEEIQRHYKNEREKKYLRENIPTLTLGSGALSILLGKDSGFCRIKGFYAMSDPSSAELCVGRYINGKLLMKTNPVDLQKKGVEIVRESVGRAMEYFDWDKVNLVVTHQVGKSHQKNVEENLRGVSEICDFVTFKEYGNMGSLSMPFTLKKAHENHLIKKGDRVLAVGFGSGLVTLIFGLEF
jgi:acyl-CoA:acyl-CoA alkyltransferase